MAHEGTVPSHRVVVVVVDGVQSIDAVGPHDVFGIANLTCPTARYEMVMAAPSGPMVVAEGGLRLGVDATLADVDRVDTLLVAGGLGPRAAVDDAATVDEVRRLAAEATRVASVCTGAALLAEAGVLDGRRATTHWGFADWMARRWPEIDVESDSIWVRDGHVWTSAGVTAGMDLALALVADDHGPEAAHTVASWMVMSVRRGGGQSQFSPQLRAAEPRHPSLRALIGWMTEHLDDDLSVARLAERAAMSERTFARAFRAETGMTPAAYVDALRVDAAQRLLETSDLTVAAIASAVGFGRTETLHRSFRRRLSTTPAGYRRHFAQ